MRQHRPPESENTAPKSGRITALKPTRRDPRRVSVHLDGAFAFSLPDELIASERLEVGDDLDEARVTALLADDQIARATALALGFLAYRPRSEREVRDRLRRGSYAPEVIEPVIAKLHEWRYLDDADFARRWVEGRTGQRPRGRRLLQQELRQKGIDRELAREAIDEADLDEAAAAEALARRRLASYAGDDAVAVRRRISAYLARRGYSFDIVRGALERVMGEAEEPEEPGEPLTDRD